MVDFSKFANPFNLDHDKKVILACIAGAFWIYFRKMGHYSGLPRKSVLSTIFVVVWIYQNYKEPLYLPIGLVILMIMSRFNSTKHPVKTAIKKRDQTNSYNNVINETKSEKTQFML
jgi:hypothetical protein